MHFKVRGAKDVVRALTLEPGRRIRVQWSDRATTEWTFTPLGRGKTIVPVEHEGFAGEKPRSSLRRAARRRGDRILYRTAPLARLEVLDLREGLFAGARRAKDLLLDVFGRGRRKRGGKVIGRGALRPEGAVCASRS